MATGMSPNEAIATDSKAPTHSGTFSFHPVTNPIGRAIA
jgi:hypothetical protein